ncbi:hypothetical protein TNCV_1111311 [Trichonephila clavipes]|nr:hypothetical protein TNCV_1111311 [Trichonephila clavipes]
MGHSSLVFKVMDPQSSCRKFESSTAKSPPSRGRGQMHFKDIEDQTSSRWCGVEVRRGSASSGVDLVARPWLKITRSVYKSPQVAE